MDDEAMMRLALEQAHLAEAMGEVPVGAVVVIDGSVMSARHNEREMTKDPTAHAEMLALRDAAAIIDDWRLDEATLAVTLEPCPMCAGALFSSRIRRVIFGAADPKAGACGSLYNLASDPRLNHEFELAGGVLADECGSLLSLFFSSKR